MEWIEEGRYENPMEGGWVDPRRPIEEVGFGFPRHLAFGCWVAPPSLCSRVIMAWRGGAPHAAT